MRGSLCACQPCAPSPCRVPSPVLIKKFSDTSKAFMGIVSSQACSGSTSALRWVSIGEAAAAVWG